VAGARWGPHKLPIEVGLWRAIGKGPGGRPTIRRMAIG
jgi:hypothetical protein